VKSYQVQAICASTEKDTNREIIPLEQKTKITKCIYERELIQHINCQIKMKTVHLLQLHFWLSWYITNRVRSLSPLL